MSKLEDILDIGMLTATAILLTSFIDYTLHFHKKRIQPKTEHKIEYKKEHELIKPKKIISTYESTKSYKTNNFSKDDKYTLLARLLLGECEGESKAEKTLVGYVVKNRVKEKKWYGKNYKEVILYPAQFSCFNKGNSNLIKMKDPMKYAPKEFLECLEVAKGVIDETLPDYTKCANHYYNPDLCSPKWASKMKVIGHINGSTHTFLKG